MTNNLMVVHSKEDAEILTVKQLAQFLGVSEDTVYSWTMRKMIPFYKVGKLVRFSRIEIIQWMQSKKVEPSI